RIGQDFAKSGIMDGMMERCLGAFSGVAVSPGDANEPPTDLVMRPEGVIFRWPGHHAGVAEECAVQTFNGPSSNAVLALSGAVAGEFFVAFRPVDGPSEIIHDLRIGMHQGERLTMAVVPSVQSEARRCDHAGSSPRARPS